MQVVRMFRKLAKITVIMVAASLVLWFFLASFHWFRSFQYNVTLPNGMNLQHNFDFTINGRDDLVASKGHAVLARDVEFVCFNDRYVWVSSFRSEDTGVYNAETDQKVASSNHADAMEISGLSGRGGCNGYYRSYVGPGLLYDGKVAPFLPRCASRNLDNEALRDRSWFDRPCDHGLTPAEGN